MSGVGSRMISGGPLVLLDLVVGGSLRPEVRHGGGHHHDIGRRGPSHHCLFHLGRGLHRRQPRLPWAPAAATVVTT